MGLFWILDCLIRKSIAHLGNVADLGTWTGLTSTTHLMFRQSVSEILGGGGGIRPPPGCEMGPKSPALLGLRIRLRIDRYSRVACFLETGRMLMC